MFPFPSIFHKIDSLGESLHRSLYADKTKDGEKNKTCEGHIFLCGSPP